MKRTLHLTLGLFLAVFSANAQLFAAEEEVVDVEPMALFVPVGFDDNDEVVVVVDGYLTDTCHKIRAPEVTMDTVNKKVLVQPRAARFAGACMDMTVPYSQVVRIGALPDGNFTIQSRSGKVYEKLDVKKASSLNADDFLYAPVDSLQVRIHTGGKMTAALYGRFTNTCLKMQEHKLINSGKTLELLPIMLQTPKTETGGPCLPIEKPFEYVVDLPKLNPGRYLLHVRSLNGQSVNEIFTNQWR